MHAVFKFIVLLSAALVVTAIPSHFARNPQSHHGLAARVASPEPVTEPIAIVKQRSILPPHRRRKRSPNGRCAANPNSVSGSAGTPAHSPTKPPASTPSSETSSTSKDTPATPSSEASLKSTTSNNTSGSSVLNEVLSGDGTFYGTGLGACGITNNDSDMIAAASELLFDTFPGYVGGNPNLNPICGRSVSVTYGGVTITVAITDRCVACGFGALDFSPTAFKKLADESVGRIHDIKWNFL